MSNKGVIYGIAINDADYITQKTMIVDGVKKVVKCPFYASWTKMLERCYCKKRLLKFPTYNVASVCDEWLTFSNFKAWAELQDWIGKFIDKDIINPLEKIYKPENCAFVDRMTNGFVLDASAGRGKGPIGAIYDSKKRLYRAACQNPFTKIQEKMGRSKDPMVAHEKWRKRKHELACQIADLQVDSRVADALRIRYLPNSDYLKMEFARLVSY
jgi:hypothetical protein